MQSQKYDLLKADLWEKWGAFETDQERRLPPPPPQKACRQDARLIPLTAVDKIELETLPTLESIKQRHSRRKYSGGSLTLEQLSYLLWATQGVRDSLYGGQTLLRTVPSAGSRHPFETYLLILRVNGILPGLYRYLGIEHQLCFLSDAEDLASRVHEACYQQYVMRSSVVFIWTAIPYRTEWRYGPLAPKLIAQDSGHLCQNLYIACESIGLGTCAIGAYHQGKMDAILEVDGEEEFAIYLATVGTIV
jgi:SagB-type dehydrogenase family enzyme